MSGGVSQCLPNTDHKPLANESKRMRSSAAVSASGLSTEFRDAYKKCQCHQNNDAPLLAPL